MLRGTLKPQVIANLRREVMKYICVAYVGEGWSAMTEGRETRRSTRCLAIRTNGARAGTCWPRKGCQSARNAARLHVVNGKVSVTDGPDVETKEKIGGL